MATPAILFPCPACGREWRIEGVVPPGPSACPRCAEPTHFKGGPALAAATPEVCHVCGDHHLYWEKDFNRRVGCAMVAIGAALTPWTYGLSLAFMALVDFILYQVLPRISVCYICKARYRGVPPAASHEPFNLLTAQTYEARAVNWAEGKLPAPGGAGSAGNVSPEGEKPALD